MFKGWFRKQERRYTSAKELINDITNDWARGVVTQSSVTLQIMQNRDRRTRAEARMR